MLTLVAAGNDDSDACTKTPARLGGDNGESPLLTIGASNVDDSKALYSNWGSCVNLWAPGTGILAARHDSDTLMTVMSGTSMATPIAAGVAVLAMEVAGDAAMTAYSHMSSPTALNVKNWMLHVALQNKITALAPSSIVPVSFVSTLEAKKPGKYVVKRGFTSSINCPAGDVQCQASADAASEQSNVASTPNLIAHIPDYMQNVANTAEPLSCDTYGETEYEEECPAPGVELCGSTTTIAPDGNSIRRPFRKARKRCDFGCVCADGEEVETYESCAVTDNDYIFTGRPCAPVYKIDDEQLTTALNGLTLTWRPLAGGESYDQVDVSENGGGIDMKCVGLESNDFEVKGPGDYRYTFATKRYDMTDDGARFFGTTYSTNFMFYNQNYKMLTLYNNGYMCFGRNFVPPTGRFDRWEDHFSSRKGPCFSFLLTDMEESKVERCSRLKYSSTGWKADSLTFTFYKQQLFGASFTGDAKPKVTVQVKLVFGTNEIQVKYGELADSLSAIIGPSKGEGVPAGFKSDMPNLPIAVSQV